MNKLFLLLCVLALTISAKAQKTNFAPKTTIGLNLPMIIDNTYELSLRKQFAGRVRADVSLGGSPQTREKFSNGKYNYDQSFDQHTTVGNTNTYSYKRYYSDKTSGQYMKLALNVVFNIPDVIYSGQKNTNYFYIGPLFGLSKFKQIGRVVTTTTINTQNNGVGSSTSSSQTDKHSEQGTLMGSGLNFGVTFAEQSPISVDMGVDILGYKRISKLQTQAHTIGLGTNFMIRINYQISHNKIKAI
jgi:hypothetical protein